MNLSIRQLKIFVLLAETLSFRKAADILHITQPTLSKLLKEIEDALGVQLFERSTRVVKLSRDGQDLLKTAKNITAMYEKGMCDISEKLRDKTNRIAIAALPTLAASLIPKLIHNLKKTNPNIRIEVYDPVADEVLDLLRLRKVDIAVTAIDHEKPSDLLYQEILDEPFVLFHSSRIRLQIKEWNVTELAGLPIISMPPGTNVRTLTEKAFQNESLTFSPAYSLRDLNTVARFVQGNCGVALLPESSFDHTSQLGIRKTKLRGALSRSVGMFTPKDVPQKDLVQRALTELLALGNETLG